MSSSRTYNDGTARRDSRSSGITRNPRFVLARTRAEFEDYSKRNRIPIEILHFVSTAQQIVDQIPENTRFRLVRTGTWHLLPKDEIEAIEFELKIRKDFIG